LECEVWLVAPSRPDVLEDNESDEDDGEKGDPFIVEVVYMAGLVDTDVSVEVKDLPLASVDTIVERNVVAEAGMTIVVRPLAAWLGITVMTPFTV
jgi:hypothetical protein